MKTAKTLILTAIIALAVATILEARTWTEASSGRTIEGDFIKVEDDNAVIARANGKTVKLPLAKLSEEDQAFIKSQSAPAEESKEGAAKATGNEVVLTGVHLCCGGCEKGIEEALADVKDVEFDVSRSSKTVTFTSTSSRKLEDALEALANAGYYGESNHESVKIADVKASDKKTDSVEISGLHLCCGSCIESVDKALETVEGFKSHNAEKGSKTFTVEGENISEATVLAALRANGFSGKGG